jgi:translocation protein SEC63
MSEQQQDQTSLVVSIVVGFLSLYLVPSTYYILRRVICAKKVSLKKSRIQKKKEKCATSTKLHLPLTIILWSLTILMITSVPEDTGPLNPYGILDLKYGETSKKIIKKAYRKLSLKYHPDKIKKTTKKRSASDQKKIEQEAQEKFIEISEAYRTLTEDAAFENWQQ